MAARRRRAPNIISTTGLQGTSAAASALDHEAFLV